MVSHTASKGDSGTAYASALFVLGALITLFAGAMLLPTLEAVLEKETDAALAFAASSLGGAFIGGALMLAMQGAQRPALMRENIALVALAWLAIPFFTAFPMWASGLFDTYEEAVFLSTSALTTTGASLVVELESAPRSFLLWRAELEWLGGYASLVMGATVLGALGTAGGAVQQTLLPLGDTGTVYERFVHIARSVGLIYACATIVGFVALTLGGIPAFDSLCMTFSSISTGGFTTTQGGLGTFHAPVAEIAVAILMLYGSMNFLTHWRFWRSRRLRAYFEEPEFWLLLVMCAIALVLVLASELHGMSPMEGAKQVTFYVFNAISLATTSGYWLGPQPHASPAFIVAAIAITLVGGATVSTAGGIKLMRTWLLVSQCRSELRRLAFPRSLVRIRFRGIILEPEVVIGVWALFISYVVTLAITTLVLGALGVDLLSSLIAAVSAIANAGPLYDLLRGGAGGYDALPEGARWLLCATMIAGRLEVLALLALFSPTFWRH